MLCLNSLTRKRWPLEPLLLSERLKSTIRNCWGKYCSIAPKNDYEPYINRSTTRTSRSWSAPPTATRCATSTCSTGSRASTRSTLSPASPRAHRTGPGHPRDSAWFPKKRLLRFKDFLDEREFLRTNLFCHQSEPPQAVAWPWMPLAPRRVER